MKCIQDPNSILIYHITHMDNLNVIVQAGALLADDQMQEDLGHVVIGYGHIKARRMGLPVPCFSGTTVGQYVPFYFCPRSIMLYIAHKRNKELGYKQGQEPIVHLVSTIGAAISQNHRCAFTASSAGAYLTDFYTKLEDLDKINWDAVQSRDWHTCKEQKQAEFLVYKQFDWTGIQGIGVHNDKIKIQVETILAQKGYQPPVKIKEQWYY